MDGSGIAAVFAIVLTWVTFMIGTPIYEIHANWITGEYGNMIACIIWLIAGLSPGWIGLIVYCVRKRRDKKDEE